MGLRKVVGARSLISSERKEYGLIGIVRVGINSESNVCWCRRRCTKCASGDLARSSSNDDGVGLSVGCNIDELSNKGRTGTDSDDATAPLNSVEPMISSDLGYNVQSHVFAESSIVVANFVSNDESVGNIAAESHASKRSNDEACVICASQVESTVYQSRVGVAANVVVVQ